MSTTALIVIAWVAIILTITVVADIRARANRRRHREMIRRIRAAADTYHRTFNSP